MASQTPISEASLQQKVEQCRQRLREVGRVLLAYSGGVDSSFLLALAVDTLGRPNVVAAMAVSTIFPQRDRKAGRELARQLDVELVEIETPQLADPEFTANPTDRCYYCKSKLMHTLKELAAKRGLKVISGANADDTTDYRPGSRAEEQLGIRRPLMEAMLTKQEVRSASAAMGLASANRPSLACLATRIPYGQTITAQRLQRVEQAEESLLAMGFSQCRVRDHDNLARVEVPSNQIELATRLRHEIVAKLKSHGFAYVTLDLQGFRSGSMNETLGGSEQR